MLGSAAFSLCMVAKGAADVYMEDNIAIWDIAAGIALVLSAGGKYELKPSDKGQNYLIVRATNTNI